MFKPRAYALLRPTLCAALLGFALLPARAAETPAEQGKAGSRIEAFEAISVATSAKVGTTDSATHCTADRRWCAQIRSDGQTGRLWLEVFDQSVPVEARKSLRYELREGDGDASPTLWPHIVRIQGGRHSGRGRVAMIGMVTYFSAGYSGGGASAQRLALIRVDAESGTEAAFSEVLSVPLSGSALIRACFSEADVKQRAEACHDQYDFSATLALRDAASSADWPEFTYETEATTFPGHVSRTEDSLANPPLTEKDLVTVVNEKCSYSRILRFDPASGRYQFDSPVPDCGDFTEP